MQLSPIGRYSGGKCLVTGKIQHETEEAAKRHAKKVRKKFKAKVHAYQCSHCLKWHIGHNHRFVLPRRKKGDIIRSDKPISGDDTA